MHNDLDKQGVFIETGEKTIFIEGLLALTPVTHFRGP